MPARTLNLQLFEEIAGNLFKGVLIIAKRARQINDIYQKDSIKEREEDDREEEYMDEEPEIIYESRPKPTVVAMEEYFEGKIKILEKE
jgi:DNA-directed RNA polymerase omega subunit